MNSKIQSVLVLSCLTLLTNCREKNSASEMASVSVAIPSGVIENIGPNGFVVVNAANGWLKSTRTFTSIARFNGSDSESVLEFSIDSKGEPLRVGDNLADLSIEIKATKEGFAIYSGSASPNAITIRPGVNSIMFKVKCTFEHSCNKQPPLEVVPVRAEEKTSTETPKLRVSLVIDEPGITVTERREKVLACQSEVKKLSCDEWQKRIPDSVGRCQAIYGTDVSQSPNHANTYNLPTLFFKTLDSLVADCKALGVLR